MMEAIRKKLFIISLIGILIFSSGYGLGYVLKKNASKEEIPTSSTNRFILKSSTAESTMNMKETRKDELAFFTQLNQGFTSKECALFLEKIKSSSSPNSQKIRLNFLFERWGEIAPKEALNQLTQSKNLDPDYKIDIFRGWSNRDPENALRYLEENNPHLLRKNPRLLCETTSNALSHLDPNIIWKWIQRNKIYLRKTQAQTLETYFLDSLKRYPEKEKLLQAPH